MAKLTHEQRIQRAHIQLMRSPEFALLSGIMVLGESKVVDDMPTAATNGVDKFYGRAFMDTLDEKQLNFVVLHENFHVMYKHLTTWQKLYDQNAMIANMACDYVINQQIVDLDPHNEMIRLPDMNLCLDPKYRGWDSKRVFDDLMQQGGACSSGDGDDSGGKGSLDDHMWKDAKSLTAEEKEELERVIDQAIRQGDILAGKLKGNRGRDIGAIPEPKVNWREQLREFVSAIAHGRDATTWRKPNRRWLAHGSYMPSAYSESIGPIVIGVDTSGSIGTDDIADFLAEIKSITETMPPERLHLLYWDTAIAREETYTAGDYHLLIESTKPAGGGGTDPTCVQHFVEKMGTKPDLVLMLSDGMLDNWPNFNAPTMWAMTTGMTAPNAVNIRLN